MIQTRLCFANSNCWVNFITVFERKITINLWMKYKKTGTPRSPVYETYTVRTFFRCVDSNRINWKIVVVLLTFCHRATNPAVWTLECLIFSWYSVLVSTLAIARVLTSRTEAAILFYHYGNETSHDALRTSPPPSTPLHSLYLCYHYCTALLEVSFC